MTDSSPLASDEWLALVAGIRFNPDDDTPRLVAADWLDETGRPELAGWAEFVRLQVEATRSRRDHVFTDSCDCGACRAERRAVLLFDRWGAYWSWHGIGSVEPKCTPPAASGYNRGFLRLLTAEVEPYRVAEVARQVAPLFARQPLSGAIVQLRNPSPHSVIWPGRPVRLAEWVVSVGVHQSGDHLVVKGNLGRPPVTEQTTIRTNRLVYTPQQFPRMARAVVAHVMRQRHKLLGEPADPRRTAQPRRGYA